MSGELLPYFPPYSRQVGNIDSLIERDLKGKFLDTVSPQLPELFKCLSVQVTTRWRWLRGRWRLNKGWWWSRRWW